MRAEGCEWQLHPASGDEGIVGSEKHQEPFACFVRMIVEMQSWMYSWLILGTTFCPKYNLDRGGVMNLELRS